MATDILKIVGFEKDLIFWVAEIKGFFASLGLTVSFFQTRSSTEEFSGLLQGKWDIAFDNADNVVAWDEGYGADALCHDLFIFLGGSNELTQALYVSHDIHEISQLKGKVLGVDAAATGYAVVLRAILQRHGLLYHRDYSLLPLGSTMMRVAKLLEGQISGAMLNRRQVEDLGESSIRLLARAKDYVHPYPARVGLATRAWAESNSALLVRFIKGHIAATDWILQPGNRDEIIELMSGKMSRRENQARRDYETAVAPGSVLRRRGAFDPADLQTALLLRVETGLMKPPVPPINKYFNDVFYRESISKNA